MTFEMYYFMVQFLINYGILTELTNWYKEQ